MNGDALKATPRPIPPGRARRRLTSTPGLVNKPPLLVPPPPYAETAKPLLGSLLGSPVIMTTQIMEYFSARAQGSPTGLGPLKPEEWVNERSREELRDLLTKAEQTIKERGEELSWTSAVCKSLHLDNSALQNKHESLMSRLPISPVPSSSFLPSPSPSPLQQTITLPITSASEPDFVNPSFSGTSRKRAYRHARRVSVTPGELAQLADQNSELLGQLERLETEAADADRAGKRKLKKLEHEIQGLREELERTQARSAEFEAKVKARRTSPDASEELRSARRKEREERVRVLRKRVESEAHIDAVPPMKDFAPTGAIGKAMTPRRSLTKRHTSPFLPESPTPILSLRTKPGLRDMLPSEFSPDLSVDSPFRFPPLPSTPSADDSPVHTPTGGSEAHQYSVISQLLAKIQELEETNAQIASQQRETGERLSAAQRDSESIRKLYDYLGDGPDVDLQIVVEDADENLPAPEEEPSPSPLRTSPTKRKTIRLQSLKRSIESNMSQFMVAEEDPFFAKDIQKDMQSTAPRATKNGAPLKSRKTIVGLFSPAVPDEEAAELSDLSLDIPAIEQLPDTMTSSVGRSPMPLTLLLEAASDDSNAPGSPPASSPQSSFHTSENLLHTLGSELGSDCEVLSGENHHLRSTSLADIKKFSTLSQLSGADPLSPSPLARTSSLTDEEASSESEQAPTIWYSPNGNASRPLVPSTMTAISTHLEIPVGPRTLRSRRLSQTVRARRERWAESRFGVDIAATRRSSASKTSASGSATPTSTTFKFMNAFDAAVDQVTGRQASNAEDDQDLDASSDVFESSFEDVDEANETALSIRAPLGPIVEQHDRRSMVEVVMELYLWIQFLLVILVFVYTMAKRGPRVLTETEKRRGYARASLV